MIFDMELKKANLWSLENPALYSLNADLIVNIANKQIEDRNSIRFGVRTFEVKKGESGGENYYLNGNRFFLKTAIDWGFYAPNGDYATDLLALKSVEAAKKMGQNGLSFHRAIGEPLVMKYADEKGLCIFEEQGGFHPVEGNKLQKRDSVGFTAKHILEKIRRMVIRDRNHPSLIIYNLSNEDNRYYATRREALELINKLDNSRLITNTSGGHIEGNSIAHIRPYQSEIRVDFLDIHTAFNRFSRYDDSDFYQDEHRTVEFTDRPYFLGEVNSVTAPSNWYKTYKDIQSTQKVGYDTNIYKENHDKIRDNFDLWQLSKTTDNSIKSAEDISIQAGRGMMYAHGRHAQSIMCNNTVEGFALNGWTPGPQSEGNNLDWDSSILDEGRNLKGIVEEYTYWTKPLQIALSRKNGKYFSVGDSVIFQANLINQGVAKRGNYTLYYSIEDVYGKSYPLKEAIKLYIEAGETFAQPLEDVKIVVNSDWGAGYITLRAQLFDCDNRAVATGSEEILVQNRASLSNYLKDIVVDVKQWDEAFNALLNANATFYDGTKEADVIIVGNLTKTTGKMSKSMITKWEQIDLLLKQAENGATLILKFDKYWADVLFTKNILSEKAEQWGGNQTNEWLGNGWGYITDFISERPTIGGTTIGTTSWEVSGNPYGFYPFQSNFKTTAYGLYLSRPWLCKIAPLGYRMEEIEPTVAVTLASIEYGKGKIILNPCYWIDENNAFTDMLFFNMVCQ
ncbi:MAG: glycoside hydrolase family 2 TIM barrel-domain containing protein [Rikenellaceae bacterium]